MLSRPKETKRTRAVPGSEVVVFFRDRTGRPTDINILHPLLLCKFGNPCAAAMPESIIWFVCFSEYILLKVDVVPLAADWRPRHYGYSQVTVDAAGHWLAATTTIARVEKRSARQDCSSSIFKEVVTGKSCRCVAAGRREICCVNNVGI